MLNELDGDRVQLSEEREGLLADGALVIHPESVELAARVGQAPGFGDAAGAEGLVP